MKTLFVIISILISEVLFTDNNGPVVQDSYEAVVEKCMANNVFAEDNKACLVCHGKSSYEFTDPITGVTRKRRMNARYILDIDEYYQSNHWSFACTDCHSDNFKTFPPRSSEKLEKHYACTDCHARDENYDQYHFKDIEVEYLESTHANVEGFSCWKCHNPHSYKITARNTENLKETILYDNNICLECHASFDNFQLLSDREEINIVQSHEWLTNQAAHFKNIRCIECHTAVNDKILVAHKVLPKEQAVKRCTECHSSDSRLVATLYKSQSKKSGRDLGFTDAVILNQSYIIGANRIISLNILSFIIFGGVLLVILFHTAIRIIKRKS